MRYTTIHNVKKSIFDSLKEKIPELLPEFSIPNKLKLLDSYPPEIGQIFIPSIILDYAGLEIRTPYDMGSEARYRVSFTIDVLGEDNYQREILAGTIIDLLEKHAIILYNFNTSPPQEIGHLIVTDIDAKPTRVEVPTLVLEYGFSIDFTVEWRQKY